MRPAWAVVQAQVPERVLVLVLVPAQARLPAVRVQERALVAVLAQVAQVPEPVQRQALPAHRQAPVLEQVQVLGQAAVQPAGAQEVLDLAPVAEEAVVPPELLAPQA
jgi:hypothetical protein